MIKKLCCALLCLSITSTSISSLAALPEPENAEVIDMEIESVELIELKKCKFEKIDLRPYANRSFVDEVAGDMTGGWSDQGPDNDMRNFDLFGDVEILGIPFYIIPSGENDGHSVLAIRGMDNMELPNRVEIPYNKQTAGVYFLHSAPYAFNAGHWVGRYSFEYTDGTIAYTDVLSSYQISDFFGTGVPMYGRQAWLGDNKYASENGYRINLSMLALKNPHPEKPVKNLVIETEGNSSFIMIVGLTFVDQGPYYLQDGDIALNPDTEDWRSSGKRDTMTAAGTAVDVSYLLDAPAGKHGFVTAENEKFVFEDGTVVKFWGTGLSGRANFPEKEEAERIAAEIAQNGFNMVRMTNLDGDYEGNIFANDEDTLTLDAVSMDKLCYLIKCLKDKGIYTYLTITSQRAAKQGDGIKAIEDVTDGYKVEGFFDERLIELQKEYLELLLTYNNPYTGYTIGTDPAVAMIEYMDSNSLFLFSGNPRTEYGISSDYYSSKLNKAYNKFITEKYGTNISLQNAWSKDYGFTEEQSLSNGNLELYGAWKNSPIIGTQHKMDIALFMADVHQKFYSEMDAVAKQCGFKGVTTSHSNLANEFEYGDIFSKLCSDFVAVNAYNSVNMGIGRGIDPAVYDSGLGVIDDIVKSRLKGKPFMVSGYNTGFGAKFTGDTILALSALAAQQGWSACQYYFSNGIEDKNDTFEIENDVTRLGLMPAAAILNNGLEELKNSSVVTLPVSALVPSAFAETQLPNLFDKRVSVSVAGEYINMGVNDNTRKHMNENFMFDSEKHLYSIKTSNTEACVGVLSTTETFDHIDYHLESAICAAALSALDNQTFETADRFLLTTVGRTRNNGMEVDQWFNISGGGDSVTEPVTGSVVLKLGDVKVYALDFSGQRIREMNQFKDTQGNTVVPITENDSAVYYEIVRVGR